MSFDPLAKAGEKARGKRPWFLEDQDSERVLNIVMALAQEVSVVRQRLDTVERLLETKGVVTKADIEGFTPSKGFEIYDSETICAPCRAEGKTLETLDESPQQETLKITLDEFSLEKTEDKVLDMSLHELGVPFLHIVAVQDSKGDYAYYQLNGDKAVISPQMSR